jgi:hypothetical protein
MDMDIENLIKHFQSGGLDLGLITEKEIEHKLKVRVNTIMKMCKGGGQGL